MLLGRNPKLFLIHFYKMRNAFISDLRTDLGYVFGVVSQKEICVVQPFVFKPKRWRSFELVLKITFKSRKTPT